MSGVRSQLYGDETSHIFNIDDIISVDIGTDGTRVIIETAGSINLIEKHSKQERVIIR